MKEHVQQFVYKLHDHVGLENNNNNNMDTTTGDAGHQLLKQKDKPEYPHNGVFLPTASRDSSGVLGFVCYCWQDGCF